MKPPVEAPTSRQSRPAGSTPSASSAVLELLAAAGHEARRLLDLELRGFVQLAAGLVDAADAAGEDQRLRLGAAVRKPALDEQQVGPLLHAAKGSAAACYATVTKPCLSRRTAC